MKIARMIFLVCCLITFIQFLQAAQPQGCVIEWGWNAASGTFAPPEQILSNTVAVSAGTEHCLALKNDGTVLQWGGNFRGKASFDNTVLTTGEGGSAKGIEMENTTTVIMNGLVKINDQILSDVISIAAGNEFSIGLKRDGTVTGWGKNSVPIGPGNVVAIAAAGFVSLAVKNDGTVIEWIEVDPNLRTTGRVF